MSLRFCANLTWLFTEVPMMERFGMAREAGFEAVEILDPYDSNAQDIVNQLGRYELKMALINGPPPNYAGGARGFAAVPDGQARFQTDFRRTLRYARTLKAEFIHLLAGPGSGEAARATMVQNLRWAATEAGTQRLTIEPLNPEDQPGYFLNDFDLAREIIEEVGAPNLHLQFDTYHAQKITGDVPGTWAAVQDIVAHVQIGQAPDRSDPAPGPVDFPAFFAAVAASGYAGWISAEYRPRTTTLEGLGWMPD